jgi:hypothetical protein
LRWLAQVSRSFRGWENGRWSERENNASPGGYIVYRAVQKEGEDELERSNAALA